MRSLVRGPISGLAPRRLRSFFWAVGLTSEALPFGLGFGDLIWLKIGHFGGLGGSWGL